MPEAVLQAVQVLDQQVAAPRRRAEQGPDFLQRLRLYAAALRGAACFLHDAQHYPAARGRVVLTAVKRADGACTLAAP